MSNMENYKHKFVYKLSLKIAGDSVIYVDDPAIADEIAIIDKKTYKYLYEKIKIIKKEEK